jgi:hypothetical protein
MEKNSNLKDKNRVKIIGKDVRGQRLYNTTSQ